MSPALYKQLVELVLGEHPKWGHFFSHRNVPKAPFVGLGDWLYFPHNKVLDGVLYPVLGIVFGGILVAEIYKSAQGYFWLDYDEQPSKRSSFVPALKDSLNYPLTEIKRTPYFK